MTRTLTCQLAVLACLLTGGAVARSTHATHPTDPAESQLALDGAFRDGLYIGQLTARSGRPERPPVGRWSDDSDRASFLAGYERGYGGALSPEPGKHERTQ